MHRPCRIMWSQRDPSVRKTGLGNIFVKNLDPSLGFKDLYDYFSEYGSILSCKVALNENGQSKGYGFVHFENETAAKLAVEKVNGQKIGSKEVYVGPFIPKKLRSQHMEQSWTNIYVKEIDPEVSNEEFQRIFEQFGPVNSSLIKRDEKSGSSEGFGFVNFLNHEDAKAAAEKLNGYRLRNKELICCRAQKKVEREAKLKKDWEQQKFNKYHNINLYVKHIDDDIDEESLKKEFSAYGEVKSCKIPHDEKGVSKGFGFVCFSTSDEAQKAIKEMNSKILPGGKKPLYVALHEPKEIRRQKLSHRHNLSMTKNIRGVQQPMYGPQGQVFYPNGTIPQGPFMYPQQVMQPMQRQGWVPGPQQFQSMPPNNFIPPGMMGPRAVPTGRPTGPTVGQGGVGGAGRQGRPNRQQEGVAGQRRPQNQLVDGPHDLTLTQLSQYPHDQQKLLIGERLYPLIVPTQGTLAGKITGMFLDSGWTTEELLSLIHDEHKLQQKIDNALEVLARAGSEQRDD